eukprot:TRINITY_DN18688_c0_g1_i1.p1 TRINITY_DN18688_c0_g1~~TRINITY_DN18688_c0_g1_i1.p1  ORF type:complete len:418 (-),score=57.67 TRINITY_DN18688_c0_g1_i1:63-1316(-)
MIQFGLIAAAFGWGILSAVSLPLGAACGMVTSSISKRVNCLLLAYGSGALLFALTIELFGGETYKQAVEKHIEPLLTLGIGAVIGAFSYVGLNWVLENRGAFLRKASTKDKFMKELKHDLKEKAKSSHDGHEGTIKSRKSIQLSSTGEARISVSMIRRSASIRPRSSTSFNASIDAPRNAAASPNSNKRVSFARKSNEAEEDDSDIESRKQSVDSSPRQSNSKSILKEDGAHDPEYEFTTEEVVETHSEHSYGNVGLAIWLGILIDGIPESFVLGILATQPKGMSFAFLVGVFLSNFPEALSSTRVMLEEGLSKTRILMLWSSITLVTGIGAAIGALVLDEHTGVVSVGKESVASFLEGCAAGAMLVMIAQTAIPEAFKHAGGHIGLSLLGGFLSAFVIKVWEVIAEHERGGSETSE